MKREVEMCDIPIGINKNHCERAASSVCPICERSICVDHSMSLLLKAETVTPAVINVKAAEAILLTNKDEKICPTCLNFLNTYKSRFSGSYSEGMQSVFKDMTALMRAEMATQALAK